MELLELKFDHDTRAKILLLGKMTGYLECPLVVSTLVGSSVIKILLVMFIHKGAEFVVKS